MVDSIDQSQIIQFSDMVHKVAQQKTSRLRPHAQIKQMSGDVFAYDGLGRVEARAVSGRNVAATFDDIDHNRRKITRQRYVVNLPVDSADVRGALVDPESNYAEAIASAALRQYDRTIYNAAFADVLTGRDFETTVTSATDGVATVDATAGLTYEKLLEIRENFMNDDVGVDVDESIYLTVTGAEHTALMKEEELISSDFNRAFVVEKGVIQEAAGIKLIPFAASVPNPIIPVVSAQRALLAASSRGICFAISKDMQIKVQERNDLIETTQVQVIFDIGAVRTEGVLVQKVNVTA